MIFNRFQRRKRFSIQSVFILSANYISYFIDNLFIQKRRLVKLSIDRLHTLLLNLSRFLYSF